MYLLLSLKLFNNHEVIFYFFIHFFFFCCTSLITPRNIMNIDHTMLFFNQVKVAIVITLAVKWSKKADIFYCILRKGNRSTAKGTHRIYSHWVFGIFCLTSREKEMFKSSFLFKFYKTSYENKYSTEIRKRTVKHNLCLIDLFIH